MGLNSVSSLSYINNFVSFDDNQIKPIDISVSNGEFLTPEQLAQKIVMKALNTNDSTKADEFMKQSGFKLEDKDISRKSENGNYFYRFEPTEKFQKSIDNFQNKGQSLPLQEFTVNVSVGKMNPLPSKVKKSKTRQNSTQGQTQQNPTQTIRNQNKQSSYVFEEENGGKTPISKYDVKRGLDNKRISVPLSLQDLITAKNNTKDGDSRYELYTQALKSLGYSDQAIKNVLAQEGITNDENSSVNLDGETKNGKKNINSWIDQKIEEWKNFNNPNSVNYGKMPRSRFILDASLRQKAFIEDFIVKGDKTGLDRFQLQLKIRDEIRAVNDKFKDIPIDNNLQKAFLELNRQNQIKDAIDKVYAESGIDFRSNQTEAQKGANETSNTIEKAIRYGLETNPSTSWMPESLKNRIVNAGIGIFNGTAYLASAGSGINSFLGDKAVDAISYGLNKLGYDTTKFDNAQTEYRQKRAEMWQAYTNLQTSNLSRLDTALEEKVRRGLPIGGMDIPSLERSIGSALPQAAIQGGIAVATGGASIPIQMAVTASVNGGMAFGATYSQTNDTWKAGEEAIWTAGQTAMIPISSKLPGVANEAFDLATGYVVGKMRGQSDAQILDSMLTQGILGAGFKAGTKFSELSPGMKQKALNTFKTVAKESQKAVDGIYNQAKAKFNLEQAEVDYKKAKTELSKTAVSMVAPILGTGVGGGNISPVKISKSLLDVGKYHLLKGANNFKEFSASVLADVGDKSHGKLLPMFEKLFGKEKANADKTYQAAKNSVNYKELETNWIGKEVKVGDKLPEGYHWNGEQIRRNGGNVDAGYAKLQVDANGRISFASEERLSNPNTMNKNFKAEYFDEVKDRVSKAFPTLKGDDLIKRTNEVIDRWEKHHVIPDGLAQTDPLMKIARQLGWNVDEGKNQIGLNKKDILFDKRFDNSELGHWSDHKKYTRKVEEALKDLINDLEAKYGKTLEAMTPEELQKAKPDILREVRKVQEKFKQQIKDGTAPNVITPNGQKRIAFIPYQQREWSIRV